MSRSNNTESANPANKFFQWDGTNGGFKYWDKEKKENIKVELPFAFLALDCLATISGYNDADKSGYWSNEIRQIQVDKLTVRTSKGIQAEGCYSDIIESKNLRGAKFCQSLYIAYYEGEELVIGNIKLTGASLGAWFEFKKANDIYKGAINVASFTNETKGATAYTVPVFVTKEVSEETSGKAFKLDEEVQEYLSKYLLSDYKKETIQEQSTDDNNDVDSAETFVAEGDDDLPF